MKTFPTMAAIYALIGVVYAMFQHFSGSGHVLTANDFGHHIAHALLWPAFMFPAFGRAIGAVVLLVLLGAWLVFKAKG